MKATAEFDGATRRIQRIRGDAAYSRYLATACKRPVAFLARVQIEHIPSPYHYSPDVPVWTDNNGRRVIRVETAHRQYDIYEISPELLTFKDQQSAEDWHIRYSKKAAA